MFRAAFTSRSRSVPHVGHVHLRKCSGFGPSLIPHVEHTWLVGSNRPILANVRPLTACLVFQHPGERRPSGVVYGLGEPGPAEPGHAQVLPVYLGCRG